ncbi:MAG: hypothetical protein JWO06_2266 [Bacteroidota bacterium]|nr:hypothetical protein [Bacteroidota bacterium]
MKPLVITIFFIACCICPVFCQTKTVHILCDKVPELRIESTTTNSKGVKKYVKDVLAKNSNDSIYFIIECQDNMVIENVLRTEKIISDEVRLRGGQNPKVSVYNKCLKEFSLQLKSVKVPDLIIMIDSTGNINIATEPVSLDSICEKYKGQPITIRIIADRNLAFDKIEGILNRFEKEKFTVLLGK